MSENTKIPTWYWVVAVIAVVWNVFGLLSFVGTFTMGEETMAEMTEAQQELMNNYPTWALIVFGIATIGGLLASLGLLVKKKWAFLVFVISLVAVVVQMGWWLFMTDAVEAYGAQQAYLMPVLVTVFAIFFVWFSKFAIGKGWLK